MTVKRKQAVDAEQAALQVTHGEDVTMPVEYIRIKELPSGGKSYPAGTQVWIRPYYFEEVFKMSKAVDGGEDPIQYYNNILRGISVAGSDMCPTELTMSDFLYLTLYRKAISLGGDKFTLKSSVDPSVSYVISISQLVFADLEVPALPIRLKMAHGEIAAMPVTYRKFLEFYDEVGRAPDGVEMLMLSIVEGDPSLVAKASGQDSINTRKLDQLLHHGLKPIETVNEGGEQVLLEVDDPSHLLLPFRESEGPAESAFSFG